MQIFRTILASIFILYIWIWLINEAFGKNSLKIQYIWKILLIGIILVGGLFSYKYLLSYPTSHLSLNITDQLNFKTAIIFGSYCMGILLILLVLFRKRAILILQIFFGGALFFVVLSFGGIILGINSLLLYYIITAYAEEYMKYTSSTMLFKNTEKIKDGIFFCVLLGLGFSLIENIFYLISIAGGGENLAGLILGRGLISALLHVVATTTIGALYYALRQKTLRPVALFISIAGGVALHGTYNIGLEYQLSYITIPLVIFLFFLLSLFLFKSDMLYAKKD
ncbi:MAG: PrsW family glutamic-type intramembrane protease [Candidatus Absconditabacteria bacterium]|nr:PrsW family glutamic-type intramembrane protease [Candidatus Absconditabacteria bacterium]